MLNRAPPARSLVFRHARPRQRQFRVIGFDDSFAWIILPSRSPHGSATIPKSAFEKTVGLSHVRP